MRPLIIIGLLACFICLGFKSSNQNRILYHEVKTDQEGGLAPWFSEDLGRSYDHVIALVWNFWDSMRTDFNGLPYYMNHQVWAPDTNDSRGIGGDQIQMALSSWQLLYAYSGNERVKQNMKFMADYYLSHSLSPANSKWAHLPYPYNTLIYSGIYDGDMVIGPGFLQPDKAGSLGLELIHLFKMTHADSSIQTIPQRYLQGAILIGRTLIKNIKTGDENRSPFPFKLNALTGEVGQLRDNTGNGNVVGLAEYTTNWSSTMDLFLELQSLDPQNKAKYQKSFNILLSWMKKFPLKNNKWGPFFEDVQGWSDTQINATTFAWYMLEHRQYFSDWKKDVTKIFDWVYKTFANNEWKNFGVTVVNEQTSFRIPGQSHTARQGAVELLYSALSGDDSRKISAIRQLNWATYAVDYDGKNIFPQDGVWLTDGYGDYIKHYLRAMAIYPELAPSDQTHILSSTSVIQQTQYRGQPNVFLIPYSHRADIGKVSVFYRAYDDRGTELVRMTQKPTAVILNDQLLKETFEPTIGGYHWTPLKGGGVLEIIRAKGTTVIVLAD